MTTRQLVSELQQRGSTVKYTVRKDGGIRITNIDGIRYTGSIGNTVARSLVGVKLSERRTSQLEKIRIQGNKPTRTLSEVETKELRKTQRLLRKLGKGTTTKKSFLEFMRKEGSERAFQALKNIQRWAKGIVYEGQAYALSERLYKGAALSDNPEKWRAMAEKVIRLAKNEKLTNDQLVEIYNKMYKIEEGTGNEDELISFIAETKED